MQHHFTEVDSVRIKFIEQNPTAKQTLVFVHGNSSSSRTWRKQFESALLRNYHLIAIDLPAHGNSQAALDLNKDYSLVKLGEMLSKTIKALDLNPEYILAGSSLGTNIIVEALNFGVAPKGIVFAGPCIVGGNYTLESMVKPNSDPSAIFSDDAPGEAVKKYARETSFSKSEDDLSLFLEDYYLTQKPFRTNFFKTVEDGKYSNEINLLNRSGIPLALIFGAEDQIINPDYLDNAPLNIWNNEVYKIPDASHLVHIDQPLEFNWLLSDYAFDILK